MDPDGGEDEEGEMNGEQQGSRYTITCKIDSQWKFVA